MVNVGNVMLKLFSAFGEKPKSSSLHDGIDQRYTRFAPRRVRDAGPVDEAAAEALRDDDAPQSRKPVAAMRPISRAAMVVEQKFNDTAHLYADSRVSVSVLRRALPERFADLS